jgi:Tfp pilus assembly protein PilN
MRVINLLPKIQQRELRFEALLRSLWMVFWLTLFSFCLVFMVQFGLRFYLQVQAGSIKEQIAELQTQVAKQEKSDIKTKVNEANNFIADYNSLAAASPKWSKLIKAFAPLVPDNLRINSLTVDPLTKAVNIYGISPTRELVIKLYNNILSDPKEFYNINYPLENVAKPKNISFHFTFFYRDDLIK